MLVKFELVRSFIQIVEQYSASSLFCQTLIKAIKTRSRWSLWDKKQPVACQAVLRPKVGGTGLKPLTDLEQRFNHARSN